MLQRYYVDITTLIGQLFLEAVQKMALKKLDTVELMNL